jgi:hypothetical protein
MVLLATMLAIVPKGKTRDSPATNSNTILAMVAEDQATLATHATPPVVRSLLD